MNYVKVFVLNLCVYFQIVIQGVDLSVYTLYVSLGESVLFVFPPPPLLWKGCHDHPVCFHWWTYRFFSPVSEYIKSLIGRLIFPLYTLCSLNGNCDCDPTTDSIVHLILIGFLIPKTFPQFGYEMIIKKTAVFFPSDPFSILVPNST